MSNNRLQAQKSEDAIDAVRPFTEMQSKFLQAKLTESLAERERMKSVSKSNLQVLRNVHEACRELLYIAGYEQCLEWMHRRGPGLLQVDIISLAIETDQIAGRLSPKIPSAVYLSKGSIDNYVTTGQGMMLSNVIPVPAALFGHQSSLLRSWAAVRLDFVKKGLLLLASKNPGSYSENQGTDLLEFFAKVVEYKLWQWQP